MKNLEQKLQSSLSACIEPRKFTSVEFIQFFKFNASLNGAEYTTMVLDTFDPRSNKKFGLKKIMQRDPVDITRDSELGNSEAIFETILPGYYLVVGISQNFEADQDLVKAVRDQWDNRPSDRTLHEPYIMYMPPALNSAYKKLLAANNQ